MYLGGSPSRFVLRERVGRRKNDKRLVFGVDVADNVLVDAASLRNFSDADDEIDETIDSAQSSSVPSNVDDDFDLVTLFRKAVTARPNIVFLLFLSQLLLLLILITESRFTNFAIHLLIIIY